jgi:hypothetical protein
VLNDLTADSERRSVFAALGSWLGPDGVLLADVREWKATAVRYANEPPHAHSVSLRGRTLQFSSATTDRLLVVARR